jgi:hypothetical protein
MNDSFRRLFRKSWARLRARYNHRAGDAGTVRAWVSVAGLMTVVLVIAMVVVLFGGGPATACEPGGEQQPEPSEAAKGIPGNYLTYYEDAGRSTGVPWQIVAGIGKVETGHGTSDLPGVHSGENSAGAGGPMQFLQPTWDEVARKYNIDGDGDGEENRYTPADAVLGAAFYLKSNGADKGGTHLLNAIYRYNHAWWYVKMVVDAAKKYGKGDFEVLAKNNTGVDECVPGGHINGPFGQRVLGYAQKWLKYPYLWGGGNHHGPTRGCAHGFCTSSYWSRNDRNGKDRGGFDCSGLTMYAIYHASGGKIKLDHYTGYQVKDPAGVRVPTTKLAVGDLIFFGSNVHHVGIYAGRDRFIHAPQTGELVKFSKLSTWSEKPSYAVRFGLRNMSGAER